VEKTIKRVISGLLLIMILSLVLPCKVRSEKLALVEKTIEEFVLRVNEKWRKEKVISLRI